MKRLFAASVLLLTAATAAWADPPARLPALTASSAKDLASDPPPPDFPTMPPRPGASTGNVKAAIGATKSDPNDEPAVAPPYVIKTQYVQPSIKQPIESSKFDFK